MQKWISQIIILHTHTISVQAGRRGELKDTSITQDPGFRGNLTHRPNEAQTQNAIIVKALWILDCSVHGYQATLAVHRCKLHLHLLIMSVSPSVGSNIFIETLF